MVNGSAFGLLFLDKGTLGIVIHSALVDINRALATQLATIVLVQFEHGKWVIGCKYSLEPRSARLQDGINLGVKGFEPQ